MSRREPALKRWCFTLNNYTDDEYEQAINRLRDANPVFSVVGKERGESNTPHLQGFVHFKNRLRFNQVKLVVGPRAHVEGARGTDLENLTYCSKDDPEAVRFGKPSLPGEDDRKANDFHTACMRFVLRESQGRSLYSNVATSVRGGTAFIRYPKALQQLSKDKQRIDTLELQRERFAGTQLRKYQARIDQMVRGSPDPRKIHWFYDLDGNTGKTWFTRFLICFRGALRFSNAKTADIAYAIKGAPTLLVFDYSRTQEEQINYAVLEDLKNGLIFSPKYESEQKMFPIPHIIVFANWAPNEEKMSKDRWDITYITAQDAEIDNDYTVDMTVPDTDVVNDDSDKENE